MYIDRNQDIISGNEDLEPLVSLSRFPVFMGCAHPLSKDDIVADFNLQISKSTGLVQLNPVIDPNIIYKEGHDSGLTGKSWLEHHQGLASLMNRYTPKSVFEIGGGHGILNAEYVKRFGDVNWTILEANPTPVSDCRAKFLKGLYDSNTIIDNEVDMLVHSHCLEHFYQPVEFFENTLRLPIGIRMCFSVPNLQKHIEKCFTNVLNFEHTFFCNESIIDQLLLRYGFEIKDKIYYKDDHSIFYATEKISGKKNIEIRNDYVTNKELFLNWKEEHLRLVKTINEVIENYNHPVFLFGAHVNSQFLISFGLTSDRINGIIDNNANKHGKRLYGTNHLIYSPSVLKDYENCIVILRSGVFNEEIKNDIINNINSKTQFLE